MAFDPSIQCSAIHPTLEERCQMRGGEHHAGDHWVIVQEGTTTAFRYWKAERCQLPVVRGTKIRRLLLAMILVALSSIGRFQIAAKWKKQIWEA